MILMLGIVKQVSDKEAIWYATLKGVKTHRFRIAALDKELQSKNADNELVFPRDEPHNK